MTEILRVENLSKIYFRKGQKDVVALDHVHFSMEKGEILGIIGKSGSGKSTLAKVIARLMKPTEGRIFLEGEEISDYQGKQLKDVYQKMQMVFQSPMASFDPRRTLGDGIGESLRNRRVSKLQAEQRVFELLGKCGLEREIANRYPHEVSGGQCQRAAIARALAIRPQLLICDEATSALDAKVQEEIIDLLSQLKNQDQQALSILFISHNLELVQRFCDRVMIMEEGRLTLPDRYETVMS